MAADQPMDETERATSRGGAFEIRPGEVIGRRFRIERELGRGGFGAVYLARDQQLDGRPVVVKVLLDFTDGNNWLHKKFDDERRALVRIDHPGVVGVLDSGTLQNGKPFLVMQFVQGSNLRALIKHGPLPLRLVADTARQVGQALTAAHDCGVHHRDLKPANVMLQDLGHGQQAVKVIDFGISTVKDSPDAPTNLTQIAGTPVYMAPEQLRGKPVAASDTWALAVMVYEMLVGRPPFASATPFELLHVQQEPVPPPSQFRPQVPPACDQAILAGLALEPAARPPARVLGEQIARSLEALEVPVAIALDDTSKSTSLVDVTSAVPPNKRSTRWTLIGVATAVISISGYAEDFVNGSPSWL